MGVGDACLTCTGLYFRGDQAAARTESRARMACKFMLRGSCRNADKCPFSHDPTTLAAARASASRGTDGGTSSRVVLSEDGVDFCKYHLVGKCSKGTSPSVRVK